MNLDLTSKDPVSAKDCSYTLASSGSKKSGKAVDFTLLDVEIKGFDTSITLKVLSFKYCFVCVSAVMPSEI